MNAFTVLAVLTVDNSVVDLETIEALYENVSMRWSPVKHSWLLERNEKNQGFFFFTENIYF